MFVIMMYISVYPVVITMRHSNVYEERSLSIYADDKKMKADSEESGSYSLPHRQTILGTAFIPYLFFPLSWCACYTDQVVR
jgi:Trk-type K+ transport system membrane component